MAWTPAGDCGDEPEALGGPDRRRPVSAAHRCRRVPAARGTDASSAGRVLSTSHLTVLTFGGKSPNPAFAQVDVPLVSTPMLSTKAGKEAYVQPVIDERGYRFTVRAGEPTHAEAAKRGTSVGKWNAFRCLMSNVPVTYEYVRTEATAGRMGSRLMAVVADGDRGCVYLSPTPNMEAAALEAAPSWRPDLDINYHPRDIKTQIYGLTKYGDLFTPRQLVALTTFSGLIEEARQRITRDAVAAGLPDDGMSSRSLPAAVDAVVRSGARLSSRLAAGRG